MLLVLRETLLTSLIVAGLIDWSQAALIAWVVVSLAVIIYFSYRSRKKRLSVRAIPGLKAVEEAVG